MSRLWAEFAQYGEMNLPTPPPWHVESGTGNTITVWPQYRNGSNEAVALLGINASVDVSGRFKKAACDLFDTLPYTAPSAGGDY